MRRPASNTPAIDFEGRAPRGSLFRVGLVTAVGIGGAVGGLARAIISEVPTSWPWPTLLVNVVGAFLLGAAVMYGRRHWSPAMLAGVSVGLLGALTTFSTLAGELWSQQEGGDWGVLVAYGAASVVGGSLAAIGGLRVGRLLR